MDFDSEHLKVNWLSFNVAGSHNPHTIASSLSKYFRTHILIDDKSILIPQNLKKKSKVSIRHYTGSRGYWLGTQVIFSGKNAAQFYRLIKNHEFSWKKLTTENCTISLGRIDLCFSRPNGFNDTVQSFDAFLIGSRSQIQATTATRYIKLQDFPSGKMLKINRRNNSLHYRVYQKNQVVRFELEFKNRQTELVQDYLFCNQLSRFEHELVHQYFKYSRQVLNLNYPYADWVNDFQRKSKLVGSGIQPLLTSYLKNTVMSLEEEKRLFRLLQLLSFIKSLGLKSFENNKLFRVKKQNYYYLNFSLNKFLKYTGIQISNYHID